MKLFGNMPVFGDPLENAVTQMLDTAKETNAEHCALMADHHLGYSVPIGGVIAYSEQISPSAVGYDIACGNKAVKTDLKFQEINDLPALMDEIFETLSFGVGLSNSEEAYPDHVLWFHPAWQNPAVGELKDLARAQLGTIGSGNHYVDLFRDETNSIWIGVHFGSRGLGHKICTHFMDESGVKDGDACVLDANSTIGNEYISAMHLAGRYAHYGRDWVCQKVASILGVDILDEVHNHHNFAWLEHHHGQDLWVHRKGATPAWPGQRGFVGGSMGNDSVILHGIDLGSDATDAMYSTVHGAGRIMGRMQAKGKVAKDGTVKREPLIDRYEMFAQLARRGIELRGGDLDEAPGCYKSLPEVLVAQGPSITVERWLRPIGVCMAPSKLVDPYKD